MHAAGIADDIAEVHSTWLAPRHLLASAASFSIRLSIPIPHVAICLLNRHARRFHLVAMSLLDQTPQTHTHTLQTCHHSHLLVPRCNRDARPYNFGHWIFGFCKLSLAKRCIAYHPHIRLHVGQCDSENIVMGDRWASFDVLCRRAGATLRVYLR